MFCKNCGKEIKEGNTFCTNCGSKISEKRTINISLRTAIIIIFVIIGLGIGSNIIISNKTKNMEKNADEYLGNTANSQKEGEDYKYITQDSDVSPTGKEFIGKVSDNLTETLELNYDGIKITHYNTSISNMNILAQEFYMDNEVSKEKDKCMEAIYYYNTNNSKIIAHKYKANSLYYFTNSLKNKNMTIDEFENLHTNATINIFRDLHNKRDTEALEKSEKYIKYWTNQINKNGTVQDTILVNGQNYTYKIMGDVIIIAKVYNNELELLYLAYDLHSDPKYLIENWYSSVKKLDKIDDKNILENKTEKENKYVGIGVYLAQNESNQVYVEGIINNQPAEEAGIQKGDIIVSVDNVSVVRMSQEDVANKLKGKEGTKVLIKVKRDGEEKEFTITRKIVDVLTINSNILDNNLGYIQIHSFEKDTFTEFEQAMDKLVNQNADKVILDLRNNGGGYVEAVEKIAGLFLDNDTILFKTRDEKQKETVYKAKGEKKYGVNLVILANEYSASATEILVASLKENERAKIVGITTYGKGKIETVFKYNSGQEETVEYEAYTKNNNKITGNGITPDYEIKNSNGKDEQLEKAKELLNGVKGN